ncbi:unnamed protein product [Amoebophrya sp. A25]|nr:unnamed protein product [Amoebophrya sp. A25]|eukprot:GSA25T00005489001.1
MQPPPPSKRDHSTRSSLEPGRYLSALISSSCSVLTMFTWLIFFGLSFFASLPCDGYSTRRTDHARSQQHAEQNRVVVSSDADIFADLLHHAVPDGTGIDKESGLLRREGRSTSSNSLKRGPSEEVLTDSEERSAKNTVLQESGERGEPDVRPSSTFDIDEPNNIRSRRDVEKGTVTVVGSGASSGTSRAATTTEKTADRDMKATTKKPPAPTSSPSSNKQVDVSTSVFLIDLSKDLLSGFSSLLHYCQDKATTLQETIVAALEGTGLERDGHQSLPSTDLEYTLRRRLAVQDTLVLLMLLGFYWTSIGLGLLLVHRLGRDADTWSVKFYNNALGVVDCCTGSPTSKGKRKKNTRTTGCTRGGDGTRRNDAGRATASINSVSVSAGPVLGNAHGSTDDAHPESRGAPPRKPSSVAVKARGKNSAFAWFCSCSSITSLWRNSASFCANLASTCFSQARSAWFFMIHAITTHLHNFATYLYHLYHKTIRRLRYWLHIQRPGISAGFAGLCCSRVRETTCQEVLFHDSVEYEGFVRCFAAAPQDLSLRVTGWRSETLTLARSLGLSDDAAGLSFIGGFVDGIFGRKRLVPAFDIRLDLRDFVSLDKEGFTSGPSVVTSEEEVQRATFTSDKKGGMGHFDKKGKKNYSDVKSNASTLSTSASSTYVSSSDEASFFGGSSSSSSSSTPSMRDFDEQGSSSSSSSTSRSAKAASIKEIVQTSCTLSSRTPRPEELPSSSRTPRTSSKNKDRSRFDKPQLVYSFLEGSSLEDERRDLDVLVIEKHIKWVSFPAVARRIREHLRRAGGFHGQISVSYRKLDEVYVQKNTRWANWIRNSATSVLFAVSGIGLFWYMPYIHCRVRARRVKTRFEVAVSADEYWPLLERDILKLTGLEGRSTS